MQLRKGKRFSKNEIQNLRLSRIGSDAGVQMTEANQAGGGVRPFTISVTDDVLKRIQAKLALSGEGYAPALQDPWLIGTSAAYLHRFLTYWLERFDWRAAERRLNQFPQFMARIEDIDIHFYHVRGSNPTRRPLVLTHGWPGSVVEFLPVIDRLTHPERFGGSPEDGFDVVIPSLPGYGFSERPASPIGPRRVAALWRRLMVDCLGYPHFFAQGGDWGAAVTCWLGADHGEVVDAIHVNFFMGASPLDRSPEAEMWRRKVDQVRLREGGYSHEQTTFPQTIGLALADSPIGFAAWVLEKFQRWGDTQGDLERRFSMDTLITNIMLYLVNDAVISSMWMYYGAAQEAPRYEAPVRVPSAVALFPREFLPIPPRSVVEQVLNIKRWSTMHAGGHFAALEEPVAFSQDVSEFFATVPLR